MVCPPPLRTSHFIIKFHDQIVVFCFFLEHYDLQESKRMPPKELKPLETLEHQELVTVSYFSKFY